MLVEPGVIKADSVLKDKSSVSWDTQSSLII